MATALDGEGGRVAEGGPHVVLARRKLGQGGGDIKSRERAAGGRDGGGHGGDLGGELVEDRELQRQRLVGGAADAGLKIGQLGGAEARGIGHRLATREAEL